MKICITSDGQGLDASVNPSFGRAPYFLFVDPETEATEAVENHPGAHGAGVQAAQLVAGKEASVVITGNIGPNAYQGLSAAAIKVYTGAKGSVKDALEDYHAGRLTHAEGPTGGGHRGGGR
jgi:predicted Fe-Mo cluster-binding NifX family protein